MGLSAGAGWWFGERKRERGRGGKERSSSPKTKSDSFPQAARGREFTFNQISQQRMAPLLTLATSVLDPAHRQ